MLLENNRMKINSFIAFFLLIAALLSSSEGYTQISPGDLAKAHSHLEGISNCTKCHTLGDKVSNEKCLSCHTELKVRIDQKKGYHSSVEVKGKQCASCHNDHHGLNFQIIKFDKDKFNHSLAGYKLTGAHSSKKCVDCHKAAFIQDAKIRAKKFTYLGLKTDCVACHTDYHQKTLSQVCSDCHNDEKFKPASKFDHVKTKYPLNGKHKEVACAECHKVSQRNGQKFQEFKGLKFANCTPCHTDVHNNKFGPKCTDCHNNESFTAVGGVQNFNHSKTNFPLEGKHQSVTCKACHKVKLTTPLYYKRCTDCHTDYHTKQFEKGGIAPDCSTCHSVNGFVGSSFTIEKHNLSSFPLKGAHIATPCFVCHKKTEKWKFREIGSKCGDCHTDIHKNYISEQYYPQSSCSNCHNESRWNAVTFDHSITKFVLDGAHKNQTCRDCHFNKEKTGYSNQKFAGTTVNCSGCHTDIHFRQFDTSSGTDCSSCHNSQAFIPASKFDHNNSRFKLDGKHLNVPCIKCHNQISDQGTKYTLYKTNKIKCEDCHL